LPDISSSAPASSPTAIIWITMLGNRPVFSIARCRRCAGRNLVAHRERGVLVHDVAGGAGNRFQGLDQRHAGGEHGRQRAREARDRRLVQIGPMIGSFSVMRSRVSRILRERFLKYMKA
jgi:hypothetical protein